MKGQKNIGYVDLRGGDNRFRDESTGLAIRSWAAKNAIDIAVWTDLPSNFAEVARCPFSVGAAVSHLRRLGSDTQKRAAEYFAKAPLFIETPLRKALQD
jgi:hypothetical protein